MNRSCALAALTFLTALSSAARAGEAVSILMAPDGDDWRVEYHLTRPATALALIRPSEPSRASRMRFDDPSFELAVDGETATIRRRDGKPFRKASFAESARFYEDFTGYLPYSRFSDGGLLVFSGRFHACADACPVDENGDEGPWRVTLDPKGQNAIVLGAITTSRTSFTDRGDGTSIYFGDGAIISTADYIAVIDAGLPAATRQRLDDLFPSLMDFYRARLAAPLRQPMMFVSYNEPGAIQGASIKGGTLPDQVFMHFEGAKLGALAADENFPNFLSFFFAHEAAHLHQIGRYKQRDDSDSWIHEGGADAFAYLALKELGAAPREYLAGRIFDARRLCAASLNKGPLARAGERGDFDAFYQCGLLLHLIVDAKAREQERDLFSLWRVFEQRVAAGAPWTSATYVEIIREFAGPGAADIARAVAIDGAENAAVMLEAALNNVGLPTPALTSEANPQSLTKQNQP